MASELLVAIDGSVHSERIVKYATSLAKKMSSGIVLLYVAPKREIPDDFREYAKEESVSESGYNDALGNQILAKYCGIVKAEGVECEHITEAGNFLEKIMIIAKERKVEMIIVGLQGLHGMS